MLTVALPRTGVVSRGLAAMLVGAVVVGAVVVGAVVERAVAVLSGDRRSSALVPRVA